MENFIKSQTEQILKIQSPRHSSQNCRKPAGKRTLPKGTEEHHTTTERNTGDASPKHAAATAAKCQKKGKKSFNQNSIPSRNIFQKQKKSKDLF